jgi:uncharacterized membrane protein
MATQTQISPRARSAIRTIDTLAVKIARHWLLYVNIFLFIFMALPFLAPVLLEYGYDGPARALYSAYSLTCHQLAYRTWFFFGAQPSYTVEQLQQFLGVNNPASDLLFWRAFLGNPTVGYKMAYCERNTAIYSSVWAAALIFGLLGARAKPLNWKLYLIFAVAPIALDGFTQLFGFRESNALLRTITGALFGAGSVWLIFPYIQEAMRDLYEQTSRQLARISSAERVTLDS